MIEWILSSVILIAVVIALRYILRGKLSLRLQYALWGLVLLRLLVPFSIGNSGISVANALPDSVPEAVFSAGIPNDAYTPPANAAPVQPVSAVPDTPAAANADSEPNIVYNYDSVTDLSVRAIDWGVAARTVWLAGVAVVGLWLLISNLRLARKLRRSRWALAVEGCRLPVYLSEAVDTPCLFGLFRPSIYVTPEAAESETQLRHILAHETTHLRHGDHIWSALRGVCLALHWYNPLVWWAAVLSRNDSELACDEATIRRIGENERAEYGRTLIGMTCPKRPALLVAATTMTGSKSSIRERITLIAKRPKMAVYTLIAVVLIAAVAVGCTFTGAKGDEDTADGDVTLYDCGGLTAAIPNEYVDQLIVRTGDELEDGPALISVYQKTEAAAQAAASGNEDPGSGWLFSLLRCNQTQYLRESPVFAQDGEWYYVYCTATAVQDMLVDDDALDQWKTLHEQVGPAVRDDFIVRNGLTPYGSMAGTDRRTVEPLDQELSQLILDYYDQTYHPRRVYFYGEEPGAPQEGDWRMESIDFLGETRLYEVMGEAYEISSSSYDVRAGELSWQACQPAILIVTRSPDGTYNSVLGSPSFPTDGMAVEDIIHQKAWGLMDLEVALWRDGYPSPVGPGSTLTSCLGNTQMTIEVMEGWEPIYSEGSYWFRGTGKTSSGQFTADCYYNVGQGQESIHTLDVTMTDLYTPRGIRVGDSRETVTDTYPELKSGDYWGKYPGQDYMWYCGDPNDLGPALLFFFEGDTVSRIVLNNMFD